MGDAPRRGWFQIHLSTAVVLMFVAGGFVWANCRIYRFAYVSSGWGGLGMMDWKLSTNSTLGFPISTYIEIRDAGWICVNDSDHQLSAPLEFESLHSRFPRNGLIRAAWVGPLVFTGKISWVGVAANFAIMLSVMGIVTTSLEWFIRRRRRRDE